MFIGQGANGVLEGTPGNKPGIGAGDGVMIAGDVRTLARGYCAKGTKVHYEQYDALSHVTSTLSGCPTRLAWIEQRFAGCRRRRTVRRSRPATRSTRLRCLPRRSALLPSRRQPGLPDERTRCRSTFGGKDCPLEAPMPQPPADPGGHRWLALGEDALPPGQQWLAPGEADVLAGLRYTKRRTEYLLRRLVTKHAVAAVIGHATDPTALAGIEVRNEPSGAPYVCVDDTRLALGVSISDRAGWAVCVTSPDPRPGGRLRPGVGGVANAWLRRRFPHPGRAAPGRRLSGGWGARPRRRT